MIKKQKTKILLFLAALMAVNILLCVYLQMQKNALLTGDIIFGDSCFEGTIGQGNCADVQLSVYGKILGVSLPIWGIVAFGFMLVIILCFVYSLHNRSIIKDDDDLNTTRKFISLCFIIGAIGAAYFIYLQLFILDAICRYCMFVDIITILSAIIYINKFKKSISFFTP